MSNAMATATREVGAEIDRSRFSRLQFTVLILCFLVAAFDGLDAQIIAFAAPALLPDLGLRDDQLGIIFSAATAGMAVGAVIFGPAGDRLGRKRVMVAMVALFGLCTLATVLATGFYDLLLIRFVTGIGMGGALPNAVTLVSEYSPQRHRRLAVSIMYMGFAVGGIIGGAAARQLLEIHGWESIFYLGGALPLGLLLLLLPLQPESLQYLVKRHPDRRERIIQLLYQVNPEARYGGGERFVLADAAVETRLANLFTDDRARNTLMLWIAFFINLLVLFFLMYWTPTLLVALGFAYKQAISLVIVFNVGGVFGALALAWMSNRWDPKRVLAGFFAVGALSAVGVGLSTGNLPLMMALALLMGLTAGGAQVGLYPMATQVYPTAIRVSGVGCAQAWGRVGSIIGPLLGGALVAAGLGFRENYLLFGLPLFIAAAAIAAMRVSNAGTPQASRDMDPAVLPGEPDNRPGS